jgi:hypothetical protein
LRARDDDGPQELEFSIPKGHITEQYVKLDNVQGQSKSPEGRTVDVVLIKELDRDYTVRIHHSIIFLTYCLELR